MKKSKLVRFLVLAAVLVILGFVVWDLSVLFNGGSAGSDPSNFDLQEQVLPYFKGFDVASGDPVAIAGSPQAVVVEDGKLAVKFLDYSNGHWLYVDPLAIRSKPWGEHPAEKVLRLKEEYGLRMSRILEFALKNGHLRDSFCHHLAFDYWPEFEYRGVVAEVDISKTFLVLMDPPPPYWRPRGLDYLTPSFFLVNQDPADLEQVRLLDAVGYSFEPSALGSTFDERLQEIFDYYNAGGLAAHYWFGATLKNLGLEVGDEMRLVGNFILLDDEVYFTATDKFLSLNAGKLYRLEEGGETTELYQTPGEIMFAMPHPRDPDRWFISSEGFEESDPRFQSMFEVDIRTGQWRVVEFPLPEDHELFVSWGRYSPDGRFLFVKRYGFVWQGGGIWVLDLSDPAYPKRQLVTWDHMLSWVPLGGFLVRQLPSEKPSEGAFPMLITAKEVDEDFAMTVSRAVFKLDGLESKIVGVKRIGKVVGWNPSVFLVEKLGEGRYRFYIAATYGFESYLKGRPFAVYVVEIHAVGFK